MAFSVRIARRRAVVFLLLLTLTSSFIHGFAPTTKPTSFRFVSRTLLPATPAPTVIDTNVIDTHVDEHSTNIDEHSYVLTESQVKPLMRVGDSGKIINAFGLWTLLASLVTGPIWMAAMSLMEALSKNDPNRALFDKTGKIWAHVWLSLTNSYPTIAGKENLMENGQPCLYVANHASWLDIPLLCTVLDPVVFKFIAKGELKQVPCIGQQLVGGHHILIDREDRRSQLRTFKEGVAWLNKGMPLMAFPEGMRSRDGRLMAFKGGIFSMAVRAQVPIVPISLSHTHAVMPSNSLLPVQPGRGKLHVHVHPAISTTDKTEHDLEVLVREALLSAMPRDQHPLEALKEEQEGQVMLV